MKKCVDEKTCSELLGKIILVDCTEDYSPRKTCVSKASRDFTSQLGDLIKKGDFYYYVPSIGVLPYVSVSRPPIAYRNCLYAPGSEGYRKGVEMLNELKKKQKVASANSLRFKRGDECYYCGTKYRVLHVYHYARLRFPFVLLYNEKAKRYINDTRTDAIIMVSSNRCVALKDVKEENIMKKYELYQTECEFEPVTEDSPYSTLEATSITDACEKFCEELGDDFMYDYDTHECADPYGNTYVVKEVQK